MAVTTNSFVIGTDQSITITPVAGGAPITLDGKRGMFEMNDTDTLLKSEVIDGGGLVDARVVKDGWDGTIEVEKSTSNFSTLMKFLDLNYYLGGAEQLYTIVETIRLPNNQGTETNTYIDCVFHGYKPGSFQKKQITKARVEVHAQQRV
jgi:hypothetical protein